jgi:site-specific DNA-cytosine methylase
MEGGQIDAAPIWSDLKSFPWTEFSGKVDILSGGYPCQPFSSAGKRLGAEDERHLWPYIASGIRILKPRVCFFENVEGHISLGLREVVAELESIGYETTFGIFSASECGASHQRKRVFILALANSISAGLQRCLREQSDARVVQQHAGRSSDCIWPSRWPSRPGEPQHYWEPPRVVGDASDWRLPFSGGESNPMERSESESEFKRPDEDADKREIKCTLGGDINGPANRLDYAELCVSSDNRTDELRLLGNGVVPATAEKAFRTLINQLNQP